MSGAMWRSYAPCQPGQSGGRSRALTFAQTEAILRASERSRLHAYIVVSLLTGARTEEPRALTWDLVDLDGDPDASPPIPPHLAVWRSVCTGGDTKTRKSRRTIALPVRCVTALRKLRDRQDREREKAGDRWQDLGLVFTTRYGRPLNKDGVRPELGQVSVQPLGC